MTAVVKRYKRHRELKKVLRVARLLVSLDEAAAGGRRVPRTRARATVGRA